MEGEKEEREGTTSQLTRGRGRAWGKLKRYLASLGGVENWIIEFL